MRQNQLHPGRFGLLLALIAALWCVTLRPAAAQQAEADPPGRVGRLADMTGQVWLYSPDANDWIAAVRNRPVTDGDRLATDAGARAEVQIGSTTLRLDASSEIEIVRIDDQQVAVQLIGGSVAARIRNADAAREFELTTDEGRFRVDAPGRYRFDRLDASSQVTVGAGQAVYEGTNSALTVTAGQHAEFWIDAAGVAQYSLTAPVDDAFAAWNNERDAEEARYASAPRYVSPDMVGADDLDRYGNWQESTEYGPIWTPRSVPVGWAPYSTGHWSYVRPWGWTWIDDAPWGFAPFHYGRWVYARNAWGWVPGRRTVRPVYAPALVAWVGGANINLSISSGHAGPPVGWFPLAPRDVYVPSYRYSPRYVREINIAQGRSAAEINNFVRQPPDRRDFGNRRIPQALTVVPAGVVSNRLPVARAAAEFRGRNADRDLINRPGWAAPVGTPPVPAPAAGPRAGTPTGVRPPPGAGRPNAGSPRAGSRDRPADARPVDATRPGAPAVSGTPRAPGAPRQDADGRRDPRDSDRDARTPARPGDAAVAPATPGQRSTMPTRVEPRRALPGDTDSQSGPGGSDARPTLPGAERRSPPRAEQRPPLPDAGTESRVAPARTPRPQERPGLPGANDNDRRQPAGDDDRRQPAGRAEAPQAPRAAPPRQERPERQERVQEQRAPEPRTGQPGGERRAAPPPAAPRAERAEPALPRAAEVQPRPRAPAAPSERREPSRENGREPRAPGQER